MGASRFSSRAEADLLNIGTYTLRTWGEAQTIRCLDELEQCCRDLADNPLLGRACDHIRPGLYRAENGKHVIFFRRESSGIMVSRILHERMLPERHSFNDEQDWPPESPIGKGGSRATPVVFGAKFSTCANVRGSAWYIAPRP